MDCDPNLTNIIFPELTPAKEANLLDDGGATNSRSDELTTMPGLRTAAIRQLG
jgi:hypothetical protein